MGNVINQCVSSCNVNPAENEVILNPAPARNNRISDLEYQNSYLNSKDPKEREDAYRKLLSFKDIKGFKEIKDIHEYYKFYKTLGKGSFGEVLLAKHIKADVECAVKVVRKKNV